jgi:hypothetical protein
LVSLFDVSVPVRLAWLEEIVAAVSPVGAVGAVTVPPPLIRRCQRKVARRPRIAENLNMPVSALGAVSLHCSAEVAASERQFEVTAGCFLISHIEIGVVVAAHFNQQLRCTAWNIDSIVFRSVPRNRADDRLAIRDASKSKTAHVDRVLIRWVRLGGRIDRGHTVIVGRIRE